tara:strand:+ start:55 stop:468 length:414 start_codon:yes stop_codon:yes gene_type:complete
MMMLKKINIKFKRLTFLILFCLLFLENERLMATDYLDFFKWNKPNHINVVKPDIDTIFKLGRIYYGLKSINLEYTKEDFIKDLKKLGFTKKEIQYYESLDLMFFMEKYVNQIRIFENNIDQNKLTENSILRSKYHIK